MNKRFAEVIRFILTGGVCTLIEYAALYMLKEWLHMGAVAATPIAFLISVVFNYVLCVRWVFSGAKEGSRKAQLGFLITSGMGFGLNELLMWLFTGVMSIHYMIAKVASTLLVMIWNYFTKRYVLQRSK